MTTIAAFIDADGNAAIAGDTCANHGGWLSCSEPKIRRVGDVLLGWSGTLSMARYFRDVQEIEPTRAGLENLVDEWIAWLKERGHGKVDDNGTWDVPLMVLAVADGQIWSLDATGLVMALQGNYWAIGSGGPTALGAMWVFKNVGSARAPYAARKAVGVAALHDPYTNDEIVVETLK